MFWEDGIWKLLQVALMMTTVSKIWATSPVDRIPNPTKPWQHTQTRDLSTVHSCLYSSFRYSFLNSVTYKPKRQCDLPTPESGGGKVTITLIEQFRVLGVDVEGLDFLCGE